MALDIQEHNTVDCKKQNNIPDSDWFELGRKDKDLAQFQQLILIVMSKKGTDWWRYQRIYYCKSLCGRMCNYFSNLNISCSKVVARGSCVGTATFPRP
jgi:hypothetical protein